MSSAHICVRSVLTNVFRISSSRYPASSTVPEFLIPAVVRSLHRSFSSSRRRRGQSTTELPQNVTLEFLPKPRKPSKISAIPFPARNDRGKIQAWLAAIDPFLPTPLRRNPSNDADISSSVTPLDLAGVLNVAQDVSVDILSHMGLEEQRWDAVVWIAKRLVEHGKQSVEPPVQLDPFANIMWPENELRSLDHLTSNPLRAERVRPPRKLKHTLENLTSIPEFNDQTHRNVKRALGQLWRSLARMIMEASESDHTKQGAIMARVLEIIAHLHHIGFIPASVYTHESNRSIHALQQPPTLNLLSSKILTALSDAQWRAHEASVKVATERLNASYFLGHEIPGSRYKVKVTEIGPELWLELVLWSCLHGGWILDGSAILEHIASPRRQRPWGLISWRELLQAEELDAARTTGWSLFQRREDTFPRAEDRARTERRVSSEVVTAFVDGLVNSMRLGVGARGTAPEEIVRQIKVLKHFLDMDKLSLGSTTWDTVMSRLLESGGIVPERRPELLLSILDLASTFGTEVNSINSTSKAASEESELPYFYEPTTIPLSLLHRTMRSFIQNGDISGAMTTLEVLRRFTDMNKQKSLEQFFEALKTVSSRQDDLFASRMPPIEYPTFDIQLPAPLLAKLLGLATESKMYELGRYFLFAEDLDGPLIRPDIYTNWAMASSIIRFGTMAGENEIVINIVEKTGTWSDDSHQTLRMPYEFLTAFLCSQIKLHRWKSVLGMQQYVLQNPGYKIPPEILATFGAELVRSTSVTSGEEQSAKTQVCHAFTDFLFTWENLILSDARNELYCVLAMLSTVAEDWSEYCSQFLAFSARQGIKLSTDDFNQVLGGVLDGYGSLQGKDMVEKWCYKPPRTFEPYRAPGGLPKMPKYRLSKGEEYESRPDNIEIIQPSGARLILMGRIHPNRQTVWAILRKIREEEDERVQQDKIFSHAELSEVRNTLKWAARLLYYLGFDHEDIIRDLGSLAALAELEAPRAPRVVGLDVEEHESKDGPGL